LISGDAVVCVGPDMSVGTGLVDELTVGNELKDEGVGWLVSIDLVGNGELFSIEGIGVLLGMKYDSDGTVVVVYEVLLIEGLEGNKGFGILTGAKVGRLGVTGGGFGRIS
jgi:hypothetical protein